jgi:hypothetical protein
MLDRSETPNLFSGELPSTEGQETPAPDTRPLDTGQADPDLGPWPPRPSTPRRSVRARQGGAWQERLSALSPHSRRARRYAPVAILVLLLLTHPAGCGRSVSTRTVTLTQTSPPPVPVTTVPTAKTQTAIRAKHIAAPRTSPPHTNRRPSPARSRLPSGHSLTPSSATPGEGSVSFPSSSFPPTAIPPSPPRMRSGGEGDEFGFER